MVTGVVGLGRVACAFVIGVLALNVAVILATGRAPGWLPLKAIAGDRLAPAVIALCAAVLLGLPLWRRRSPRIVCAAQPCLVLFCALLSLYLANDRTIWSGDTLAARYLPVSVLRSGDFFLDPFPVLYQEGQPYYLERVDGRYVSGFPVGAAVLAVPLYVPSVLGGGWTDPGLLEQLEKLAAATMVALSAAVLYATIRLVAGACPAWILTLVYGLGTSSLSLSSQALWQHGPSQLALAAGLYCLVQGRTARAWYDRSALPMALAIVCRPSDLVVVAPLALYAMRKGSWRLVAWGLVPIAFQIWYNVAHFGHVLHSQWPLLDRGLWSMALSEGLAGMLFTPGRGLFVFSPVFVFSVAGMVRVWWPGGDGLFRMLSVGVVAHVLLYSTWHTWYAGLYYGPRYHADLTPGLTLLIVPVLDWLRQGMVLRALFAVLALWSVAAHVLGIVPNERAAVQHDGQRTVDALRSWDEHPLVGWVLDAGRRGLAAMRRLPVSDTSPELIGGRFEIRVASPIEAPPGALVYLPVEAVNVGAAVWRGGPGAGAMRVEWQWTAMGESGRRAPSPGTTGRVPLRRHVLPGDRYTFFVSAPAPLDPARYGLEVALAGPGYSATTSMVVGVDIVPVPRRSYFPLLGPESLSAADASPGPGPPPRVAITLNSDTFSPGSRLRVGIEAENPLGAPAGDLYAGIAPASAPVLVFFAGPRTISTLVSIGQAADFVRMRILQGGMSLRDERFFEFPVNRYLGPGTYHVFAALIPAGGQHRLPWDVVAASVKTLRVVH